MSSAKNNPKRERGRMSRPVLLRRSHSPTTRRTEIKGCSDRRLLRIPIRKLSNAQAAVEEGLLETAMEIPFGNFIATSLDHVRQHVDTASQITE